MNLFIYSFNMSRMCVKDCLRIPVFIEHKEKNDKLKLLPVEALSFLKAYLLLTILKIFFVHHLNVCCLSVKWNKIFILLFYIFSIKMLDAKIC